MAPRDLLYRAMNVQANMESDMLKETIPFVILATLAVVARGFSRRYRKAVFGADDFTVLLALVSFQVHSHIEPWRLLLIQPRS